MYYMTLGRPEIYDKPNLEVTRDSCCSRGPLGRNDDHRDDDDDDATPNNTDPAHNCERSNVTKFLAVTALNRSLKP